MMALIKFVRVKVVERYLIHTKGEDYVRDKLLEQLQVFYAEHYGLSNVHF